MNPKLAFASKIIVSGLLLWWAFSSIDFSALHSAFTQVSWGIYLAAVVLYVMAMILNTAKWRLFLPNYAFSMLLKFTFVGQFYSLILPGQITGEMAKAFHLGKNNGDMEKVGASVLMEKITGLCGLLLLAAIGVVFTKTSIPFYTKEIIFLAAALFFLAIWLIRIKKIYQIALKLPYISKFITSYYTLSSHTKRIFLSIFLGAIFQMFAIAIDMLFAHSLGVSISFLDWFWIFGLISGITFFPVSIGGLGVREVSFVGILALFSVASSTAVALSLLVFSIQIVAAAIGGIMLLPLLHYSK